MKRLMQYRIACTLTLAVLLIGATALRRGADDGEALKADLFWAQKLSWRAEASCVIAGDSRACRALVPNVLDKTHSRRRTLNFAFDSSGYSAAYLNAIEAVLDPHATERIVLLGITPYSLTPTALATNEFEYRRNWMPFQSMAGLYAKQSLRYVHPMRVDQAYDDLIAAMPKAATNAERDREFHDDGWLAMNRHDGRENVYAEHYRASFEGNTVDSEIVEQLLQYVRDWREKGIRVIAFRPPVSEIILSIENEYSGFDESAFRAAFEAAGGRWIDIEPTRYVTYDGSHVGREEAERFTANLAKNLASLPIERVFADSSN